MSFGLPMWYPGQVQLHLRPRNLFEHLQGTDNLSVYGGVGGEAGKQNLTIIVQQMIVQEQIKCCERPQQRGKRGRSRGGPKDETRWGRGCRESQMEGTDRIALSRLGHTAGPGKWSWSGREDFSLIGCY